MAASFKHAVYLNIAVTPLWQCNRHHNTDSKASAVQSEQVLVYRKNIFFIKISNTFPEALIKSILGAALSCLAHHLLHKQMPYFKSTYFYSNLRG